MNERWLVSSFTASSLIHLGIIPLAALVMHAKPIKPATVPIELVDVPRVEEPKKVEVAPPPPRAQTQAKKYHRAETAIQAGFRNQPAAADRQHQGRNQREAGGTAARFIAGQRRRQGRLERRLQGGRGGRQRRRRRQSFWQGRRRRGRRQRRRRRRRRKRNAGLGRGAKGDGTGGGAAEKRFPAWLGLSAVIKSSRAIRSRRAERVCRA